MHGRGVGKRIGAGFALAALASALFAVPASSRPAPAANVAPRVADASRTGRTSTLRTAAADPEITLCASIGDTTMPDGEVVPIWGYSLDTGAGCGPATLPGPLVDVTAGSALTVHVTNVDVPQNVSLVIPGTTLTPDVVGVASGATATYTFIAEDPGTYLYQSGVGDQRGALMGLYGALVVRPATAGQAYDTAASAYDSEAVLVLSEVDPSLNADPTGFNLLNYAPEYWLINGTAYPDTDTIAVGAGQRALLRYLNAGSLHHTMSVLGTHQSVIAKDAVPVSFPFDVVAETVPAGATLDTIATVPAAAAAGARLPIYSRQLHLTNAGAFPGGMLTYLEVSTAAANQPPSVEAGSGQTVAGLSASLSGTVADEGLVQPLATAWSKVSGPGTVTFGDGSAVHTTATFSAGGDYVLRLTADDGQHVASDDVTITADLNVHVGDLDGTSAAIAGNRWRATVAITVHDALHHAASGATVTGTWSAGDTNGRTVSCTINGTGTCSVTSGRISRATSASVSFTVTAVSRTGSTYRPSANHDPDTDSNGTTITVNRP